MNESLTLIHDLFHSKTYESVVLSLEILAELLETGAELVCVVLDGPAALLVAEAVEDVDADLAVALLQAVDHGGDHGQAGKGQGSLHL